MIPKAGWYAAPGEPGVARYWDGELWTAHRHLLPPSGPAAAVASDAWTPERVAAAAGAFLASDEGRRLSAATASSAFGSDGFGGTGSRRVRRGGPVTMIGLGAVFLLVSVFSIKPAFWDGSRPGAGEVTVEGTVISQNRGAGRQSDLCSPLVSYEVDGVEYVATSRGSTSECPVVGSSAEVIYPVADPADGRAPLSTGFQVILLLFPLAGLLLIAGGVRKALTRASAIGRATGVLGRRAVVRTRMGIL